MSGYRLTVAILSAAAVLLAAAACSGDEQKSAATATTQSPAAAGAAASAPAPASGSTSDAPAATAAATSAPAAAQGTPAVTRLNLNTATAEQFKTIPNVGDRFVREFNEYRPYSSILQFRRELGKYVSQDQVKQWEQYLYVPVDINQADSDTLQQIPGVTAAMAQQLVASRPYTSADTFVIKLSSLIGAEQASAARPLLAGR